MMKLRIPMLAGLVLTLSAQVSQACFMRSVQPVQVWLDHIHVDIVDQVAVKTYHCTFKNPNSQAIVGGTCYMELEPGTQVDNMSVIVNGKETKGEILDVNQANKVFTEIVKNGGSPALLEYYGNQLVQTKVPKVAAGTTVTVKLKYTTLLKNRGGLVRLQMLNTNPKALMQPLKSASVTVNLKSKSAIKNLYSPTHEIKIKETPEWDVTATWQQDNYLPKAPFVLYYQLADDAVGASLLTHREVGEDGSFMLMLSPTMGQGKGKITEAQILPKDIVFCVDTSGSMLEAGKMEQARSALKYCVEHLRAGDRFNIVDFSTTTRSMKEKGLIEFNETTLQQSRNYIKRLAPRGGTAIAESLARSLDCLSEKHEDGKKRLKMIVFATDGLPTIGERDPSEILKQVDKLNNEDVRVFVFGQGFQVNTKLLDFLALNHRGESEYILPKEEIDKKISQFFDRIGSPLMADLKVEVDGLQLKDVFPRKINDIYKGEQIVVYGRYSGHGEKTVRLTGTVKGETKTFEYQLDFPEMSEDDKNSFVPRLWAGQKVDFLLNEIRAHETENKELIQEVTFLAKRYGIVTPYTSFLMCEDLCTAPQGVQVTNFVNRMRGNNGGLRGQAYGKGSVTNAQQQAVNRRNLYSQGAFGNYYKQAELAMQQEGRNGQSLAAIRYVNNRTFYQQNNRWYDSRYDTTQKTKVQNIDIGSKEYIELLTANPKIAPFLANGEVTLEVKGQWYQFNQRRS